MISAKCWSLGELSARCRSSQRNWQGLYVQSLQALASLGEPDAVDRALRAYVVKNAYAPSGGAICSPRSRASSPMRRRSCVLGALASEQLELPLLDSQVARELGFVGGGLV